MEQGIEGSESQPKAVTRNKTNTAPLVIRLLFLGFIFAWLVREMPTMDKPAFFLYVTGAVVIGALMLLNLAVLFWERSIGAIDLVQITSFEFERRIRTTYQAQTARLTALGFDQVFFVGDSSSLFRLFLILPAIVVFQMWRDKVPMTVRNGTELLTGNPVFISRDKKAYAHPNSLGFTFHTRFEDGTLLITKNFSGTPGCLPVIEVNLFPGASMSRTWAAHQDRLQALETEGRQVDRQSSFQAYREIVLKEQAHV